MPVIIQVPNTEPSVEESAERWEYTEVAGGTTVVELLDEKGQPTNDEYIAENVLSVNHITEDEYEELLDMLA